MSEVGLSINEHTLDLAVFQTPDPSMPTLCKDDLQSWILGMHSTVAEVIAGLQSVRVVGSRGNQYGVQDTTGASIVIEFVKGELRIHNNSVGSDNTGVSRTLHLFSHVQTTSCVIAHLRSVRSRCACCLVIRTPD